MSSPRYEQASLTLSGTVAMGTGVMIGAGIFALTGQVAELAGQWFPAAFVLAAVISGFSAYSYIRVSSTFPSAGGIGMILHKAYGDTTLTGWAALLMALSMVIYESLVARTFGTYLVQPFDVGADSLLVPGLGVALIAAAFAVNVAGNQLIDRVSKVTAIVKVAGILLFAGAALWASGWSAAAASGAGPGAAGPGGFLAGVALAILAFKGFTTITNSGGEVIDPHRNVGRAIVISLAVCLVVYLAVVAALRASLPLDQLVAAKDFALAEAARPALGSLGVWFTVAIAVIATASGILASIFAVSRMLAMLSDMRLVPHRHLGLPGTIQTHTLIYTVVIAAALTMLFDLSRIASLGAILYLTMDLTVHVGVLRHLREEVNAKTWVLLTAIGLDVVVLATFLVMKTTTDPAIVLIGLVGMGLVFLGERVFLTRLRDSPRWTEPTKGDT